MAARRGLRPRVRVELVLDGDVVVDEELGVALQVIEERGSILAASRALGIPYSRLWEKISRASRILGGPLVEARKGGPGGGGARLTELGLEVLRLFRRAYEEVHGHPPSPPRAPGGQGVGILVYAGSSDVLLDRLLGELRSSGIAVEAHWLGSLGGLASVLLGDAHLAGLHLLDPRTGAYNEPYARGAAEAAGLALVRGYQRSIGLASREPLSLGEAVEGLLSGRLRLVNRPRGTGTRLLLERLLLEELERRGSRAGREALESIRGWSVEARTHLEAAEAVARGEADVALVIEPAARFYGLHYRHVRWEWFDFLYHAWPPRGPLRGFHEALCSGGLDRIASELPGYRVSAGERCRRIL